MKKGFTLIELLVVIAVLSTAGLLVLSIFTNSLRGSNKAQILSSIQKNGRSSLETMDKTIRNSDGLICVSNSGSTLVVVKDGNYTRYRFIAPTTSVNGQIQQDNPVKDKNTIGVDPNTSQEYTDPAFKNKICADSDPLQSQVALTDTDPQSGVSVLNGLFTNPNQSSGFKNQITIKFDLKEGVGASSLLTGQISPENFVTTINLR